LGAQLVLGAVSFNLDFLARFDGDRVITVATNIDQNLAVASLDHEAGPENVGHCAGDLRLLGQGRAADGDEANGKAQNGSLQLDVLVNRRAGTASLSSPSAP
jgi:hypothetical protein